MHGRVLAFTSILVLHGFASFLSVRPALADEPTIKVFPASAHLKGAFSTTQLLVCRSPLKAGEVAVSAIPPQHQDSRGEESDAGKLDAYLRTALDLTTTAHFESSNGNVVTVDPNGRLTAQGDGEATVTVRIGDSSETVSVPVSVTGVSQPGVVEYLMNVSPILSKAGCNSGACHASQHGKGGLVLSVLGFDPAADHKMLVRDRDQRRVNLVDPARSLLLLKPTMAVAHGGGLRLRPGSTDYQILEAWLAAGAPGPDPQNPEIRSIEVWPKHRLSSSNAKHQLRVVATYSNGELRDVTPWAKYDSLDDSVISVNAQGVAKAVGQGQASVMVRFEGHAQVSQFVIPLGSQVQLSGWKDQNYLDEFAATKFRELGIEPSGLCDDATFIRRAFLDALGSLPTPEQTLAFLNAGEPDKRIRLVHQLLGLTGDPTQDIYNDRYTAYWTLKWSDLVRNTSREVGEQGMWALHNWLLTAFRENRPMDQIVRDLVVAKGSIYSNGPANYYLINRDAAERTESTAQLFLGVRLECAKCHHHPFEKYSQDDYYSFSAFFSRVGLKNSQEFGLFGREQVVVVQETGDVKQPRTGKVMSPRSLDGESLDHNLDRRIPLADWLTSANNPFFARSIVNRYMGYLLGRGLVEPIDDMRSTNPPSNPEMLEELARRFVESKFNLRLLMRDIMTSRLYQLSSQPTKENSWDHRFYSHYHVRRLNAEPLLDAVDRVTGIQTKFRNLPLGTRATQLPDAEYPDYFLNTFAKPRRASVCECERSRDENLSQALHTLNGDILAEKIAHQKGTVAKLMAGGKSHLEIVEQLYLTALCRRPNESELAASWSFLDAATSPKECYEDLLWALINSKQFLFVH